MLERGLSHSRPRKIDGPMRCLVEIEGDRGSIGLLFLRLSRIAPCEIREIPRGQARLEACAGAEPDGFLAELHEILGEFDSEGRSLDVHLRDLDRAEPTGWEMREEIAVGNVVISPAGGDGSDEPGPDRVLLDVGRAFGAGLHPTTRLCLNLMTELSSDGTRVADVGCGSGILALTALRLGAREAVGLDFDPEAVRIAKANAELNQLLNVFTVVCGEVRALAATFDMVLANLAPASLLSSADEIGRLVERGGRVVLSGFWPDLWGDLEGRFAGMGFKAVSYREFDGWGGAVLSR